MGWLRPGGGPRVGRRGADDRGGHGYPALIALLATADSCGLACKPTPRDSTLTR
jgi:hypothetical protein